MFDQVLAEIDEETESFVHQPQISQDLFAMNWLERGDRFHFHDHAIVDDQIGTKAFVEPDPIPCDRYRHLSFDQVAAFPQLMREGDFIYDFENAWPEPGVQAVGSIDDQSRDFILSHAAKPGLLLPACEAKNLRALASLRDTSDSKYVGDLVINLITRTNRSFEMAQRYNLYTKPIKHHAWQAQYQPSTRGERT